jgi:Pregnancy-associated plasma protein-A
MPDPIPPIHRKCGAMEVHHRLLEEYAPFRAAQADLEHRTRDRRSQRTAFRVASPTLINIPIVVHVIWNTEAENVSDAQVQSQIAALNRDYGASNTDRANTPPCWNGLVTAADIQFHLANTDPNGNASSGITRTQTSKTSFSQDDSVKSDGGGGADPWPASDYLNLWVCTLADGLLGYAQFPGGPPATDGVVILNTAFGTAGTAAAPFNLGRTATHEVGHYFNLRHIWGDTEDCSGNDFVDDTPNAQLPNYNSPTFPHVSCDNGPNGDMFMNYMDYVDDRVMVMFTAGQVVRMQAALDGPRNSLLSGTA